MFTVFAERQFEHMTKFLSFLLFTVYCSPQKIRSFISVLCPKQLVITKGYGVPGDNKIKVKTLLL